MTLLNYWNARYKSGAGAGAGSKGDLYAFKLETVQKLVDKYKVKSVVDYGCGDGHQLADLKVKDYLGLDISPVAIEKAQEYAGKGRQYYVIPDDLSECRRDMAVSLDVIPHLPDGEYEEYMANLFFMARKYVLIYAPNRLKETLRLEDHMHFRVYTDWIEANTDAKAAEYIPNRYPAKEPGPAVSFSEFFLFEV